MVDRTAVSTVMKVRITESINSQNMFSDATPFSQECLMRLRRHLHKLFKVQLCLGLYLRDSIKLHLILSIIKKMAIRVCKTLNKIINQQKDLIYN